MQIVIRQISGLGNQLFQYAAGRYYATHYDADLRVSIAQPQNAVSHGVWARPFLLSHFCIQAPTAPVSKLEQLMFSSRTPLKPVAFAVRRALRIQSVTESIAQRHTFREELPLGAGTRVVYLSGYWQTYRIAEQVETQLRREFSFREHATGKTREVLQQIRQQAEPVSLHIRRGDYTLAIEGNRTLPIEYYTRAIAYFRERLSSPVFYVFSDDIPFARANLPADLPAVFVDHNDDQTSHEDLRLMSACRHHIIANSSFSWWGAWLNPRADKMVVAPRYWMLTPDSYFPDLLSPGWMIVPDLNA